VNIFVSNLSSTATEKELMNIFNQYGIVDSTTILKDKFSFKTMRFGFVEMPNETEALQAIEKLNGKAINGRKLNVHKARINSGDRRNSNRNGGRRCTDC
jgi:RNA recognition motif-containing protein